MAIDRIADAVAVCTHGDMSHETSLHIRIPTELHHALRVRTVTDRTTITAVVIRAIEDYLQEHQEQEVELPVPAVTPAPARATDTVGTAPTTRSAPTARVARPVEAAGRVPLVPVGPEKPIKWGTLRDAILASGETQRAREEAARAARATAVESAGTIEGETLQVSPEAASEAAAAPPATTPPEAPEASVDVSPAAINPEVPQPAQEAASEVVEVQEAVVSQQAIAAPTTAVEALPETSQPESEGEVLEVGKAKVRARRTRAPDDDCPDCFGTGTDIPGRPCSCCHAWEPAEVPPRGPLPPAETVTVEELIAERRARAAAEGPGRPMSAAEARETTRQWLAGPPNLAEILDDI